MLQNGIPVGVHRRSANPPTVSSDHGARPTPTVAATAAPLAVAWHSADADGDTLMATVEVSSDGGRTWTVAFGGPDHGSALLPASAFAKTRSAKVRVRVSDGFDQAVAVSPAFSAAGVPPDVAIVAPVAQRDGPGGRGRSASAARRRTTAASRRRAARCVGLSMAAPRGQGRRSGRHWRPGPMP